MELEQKKNELARSKEMSQLKIKGLNEHVDELESETEELKDEIDRLEIRNTANKRNLDRSVEQFNFLNQSMEKLRAAEKAKDQQMALDKASLRLHNSDLSSLKMQIKSLESQLLESKTEARKRDEIMARKDQEIADLTRLKNSMDRDLDQNFQNTSLKEATLKQAKEYLDARVKGLLAEVQTKEKEIEELGKNAREAARWEGECRILSRQIEEMKKKQDDDRVQPKNTHAAADPKTDTETENLAMELDGMDMDLYGNNESQPKVQKTVPSSDSQVKLLKSANASLKREIAELRSENDSIKAKLNNAEESDVERLQFRNLELEEDNGDLKFKTIALQTENDQLKVQKLGLQEENAALKVSNRDMGARYERELKKELATQVEAERVKMNALYPRDVNNKKTVSDHDVQAEINEQVATAIANEKKRLQAVVADYEAKFEAEKRNELDGMYAGYAATLEANLTAKYEEAVANLETRINARNASDQTEVSSDMDVNMDYFDAMDLSTDEPTAGRGEDFDTVIAEEKARLNAQYAYYVAEFNAGKMHELGVMLEKEVYSAIAAEYNLQKAGAENEIASALDVNTGDKNAEIEKQIAASIARKLMADFKHAVVLKLNELAVTIEKEIHSAIEASKNPQKAGTEEEVAGAVEVTTDDQNADVKQAIAAISTKLVAEYKKAAAEGHAQLLAIFEREVTSRAELRAAELKTDSDRQWNEKINELQAKYAAPSGLDTKSLESPAQNVDKVKMISTSETEAADLKSQLDKVTNRLMACENEREVGADRIRTLEVEVANLTEKEFEKEMDLEFEKMFNNTDAPQIDEEASNAELVSNSEAETASLNNDKAALEKLVDDLKARQLTLEAKKTEAVRILEAEVTSLKSKMMNLKEENNELKKAKKAAKEQQIVAQSQKGELEKHYNMLNERNRELQRHCEYQRTEYSTSNGALGVRRKPSPPKTSGSKSQSRSRRRLSVAWRNLSRT